MGDPKEPLGGYMDIGQTQESNFNFFLSFDIIINSSSHVGLLTKTEMNNAINTQPCKEISKLAVGK